MSVPSTVMMMAWMGVVGPQGKRVSGRSCGCGCRPGEKREVVEGVAAATGENRSVEHGWLKL